MLRHIEIHNVRMLDDVEMDFPDDRQLRWHVVIGDNGSGKTTLVRCVCLGLVGGRGMLVLRQAEAGWLGTNGSIAVTLNRSRFRLVSTNQQRIPVGTGSFRGFGCAFGAMRRFSGGDRQDRELEASFPEVLRYLSAFSDNVDFSGPLSWLQQLKVWENEGRNDGSLLGTVLRFVNESGLPNGVQLTKVLSDAFEFTDASGATFGLSQLADGYRSVLAIALELLHQLHRFLGHDDLFEERDGRWVVAHPGLVLIDEVDAHLHPSWQASIGEWFLDLFPQFTFLVTTHSPLVCRAAVRGTVWRLRSPGEDGPQILQITGEQLDRLVYGDLNQALESEAFQLPGVARSSRAREKIAELAKLHRKRRRGQLAPEERTQLQALQSLFPDQVRPVE